MISTKLCLCASGAEVNSLPYQRVLEGTLGHSFSDGNRERVLRNGIEIFLPMIEAIRQACFSMDLLTFVYWKGAVARRFADALIERAKSGVRVRVILDAIGALKMSKSLIKQMRAADVHVAWFRPTARWQFWTLDNRTHRKVLVCDGRIAFTGGGVGIAEEWEDDARNPNEWRDILFQVEGPAVPGLQAAFLDNGVEAGRSMQDVVTQIGNAETLKPLGKSHIQVAKTIAAMNWGPIATS